MFSKAMLVPFGSVAACVWQSAHSLTSRRLPWATSGAWQALHWAVVVSEYGVGGPPAGTKSKTGFADSSTPSYSRSTCMPME